MNNADNRVIVIGRVGKTYGVHGWIKIHSFTEPKENILDYTPWQLFLDGKWQSIKIEESRKHGEGFVALLANCKNPEEANYYVGAEIAIFREQLPPLEEGEYYWTDLEGLTVLTTTGTTLGIVDHFLQAGGNPVMVVKGERERLIPFRPQEFIVKVDLQAKTIEVNWDPEF